VSRPSSKRTSHTTTSDMVSQIATSGARRDLGSPVSDDDGQELPRWSQSRAGYTLPCKFRERVCVPFAPETWVARPGGKTSAEPKAASSVTVPQTRRPRKRGPAPLTPRMHVGEGKQGPRSGVVAARDARAQRPRGERASWLRFAWSSHLVPLVERGWCWVIGRDRPDEMPRLSRLYRRGS
jgi:hypothetical protein